jgi:hypothetical protein
MQKQVGVVAFAAIAFGLIVDGASAAYTFTKIVDTATTAPLGVFSQFSVPAISGNTVAFEGDYNFYPNVSAGKGVFSGSGGPLTAIAKQSDAFAGTIITDFFDPVTISDGTVAFHARTSKYDGIFTGNGGPLTTIVKTADSPGPNSFGVFINPVISHGVTLFSGAVPAFDGVFAGSGGPLSTIVKTNDIGPNGSVGIPCCGSISGSHVVFGGGAAGGTLYVTTGGQITQIAKKGDATPAGKIVGFAHSTITGDTAVFLALLENNTYGIFSGNGGPLTQIVAEGSSPNFPDISSPSAAGAEVAFNAGNVNTVSGIYAYNNGTITSVIQIGDQMFGQTVTGASIGTFGLDAEGSGRIAFVYRLSDSTSGIAVAVPVPEPASIMLLALGFSAMTSMLVIRSRRQADGCD